VRCVDQVILLFLDARRTLPHSEYEADLEALNLFSLVIRHVEGVLALARNDLVLAPPACACARAAFESAAKAAWMVNADDPFEREARWLAHLAEEERVYKRAASRSHSASATRFLEQARVIGEFRQSVENLMPKHIKQLSGNPNFEEMIRSIGGDRLYSLYIYLSQFTHGGHLASGTYGQNLGTAKIIGEFVIPANWYIAFRVCWLSLSQPGNIILSRVSNSGMQYLNPQQELT
jgi:hypothetical protein